MGASAGHPQATQTPLSQSVYLLPQRGCHSPVPRLSQPQTHIFWVGEGGRRGAGKMTPMNSEFAWNFSRVTVSSAKMQQRCLLLKAIALHKIAQENQRTARLVGKSG